MGKLFGTDGVRGVANLELTAELAFNLGRAGGYVLTRKEKGVKILVCKDTRVSGDMLEAALTAGLCSLGADVYQAGVLPTPGAAYLVKNRGFDAGVVISASHNQMEDNGLKFFNKDGYKLPDSIEDEIEQIIYNSLDNLPKPTGADIGRIIKYPDGIKDYIKFLTSTADYKLDGLKIALDCANGATSEIAPMVFKSLNADVIAAHNKPDGYNINKECGSTHMASLAELVKESNADIGLAFDGDGDRMLAVDEHGYVLSGDEIMSICAYYLKMEGRLKKDTLVVTVMSNMGLFIMGSSYGINIEKTQVGDRYILERMLEEGYNLGGEQSGHIIFLDYNTVGDGILMGLILLSIMKKTGKSLSELNDKMEMLPQVLVSAKVSNDKKQEYLSDNVIMNEIKLLEDKLAGQGRILIRPSGTEPVIRVMLEGRDKEFLQTEASRIAGLMELL